MNKAAILFALTLLAVHGLPVSATDEDALLSLRRSAQCSSWDVMIFPSGFATAVYADTCGREERDFSRLVKLSPTAVRGLEDALAKARFLDLPDHVEPVTVSTDDDFLSLKADTGGQKHTIILEGLQFKLKTDEIERFRLVWTAVDRLIPEPPW